MGAATKEFYQAQVPQDLELLADLVARLREEGESQSLSGLDHRIAG
jgi:hypothetical protein